MNIAFLAHDKKKELMVQFCTAYKSVLMKHNLFATATTGRLIADNTGLPITLLLSHKQGGHQQINARIAYNEIDLVLLFTDPNTTDPWDDSQMIETIRHCDKQNVPIAFAAWGRQNCPEICREMRALCNFCFDTPRQLEEFQFGD